MEKPFCRAAKLSIEHDERFLKLPAEKSDHNESESEESREEGEEEEESTQFCQDEDSRKKKRKRAKSKQKTPLHLRRSMASNTRSASTKPGTSKESGKSPATEDGMENNSAKKTDRRKKKTSVG
ncbi:hypothetical protein M758_UG001300 [Ceratodon purpureus]|nr:hypothetical protein M758_UG001300 [Ceratodon purpureus]